MQLCNLLDALDTEAKTCAIGQGCKALLEFPLLSKASERSVGAVVEWSVSIMSTYVPATDIVSTVAVLRFSGLMTFHRWIPVVAW